jgi:hypothetical protein
MYNDWYHKWETLLGASIFSWVGFSHLLGVAYPVISFIAVVCGAILGVHGVYCLITGKHSGFHIHHGEHKDHG